MVKAIKWKITYGTLCLLLVVAYSMPWASWGGQTYTGLNMTLPFSFTYVIGIILGLIALLANYKPVGMTILAGILIFLGIVGGMIGAGIGGGVSQAVGKGGYSGGAGMGLAFLLVIIYMILGSIAAKKFRKSKVVTETK